MLIKVMAFLKNSISYSDTKFLFNLFSLLFFWKLPAGFRGKENPRIRIPFNNIQDPGDYGTRQQKCIRHCASPLPIFDPRWRAEDNKVQTRDWRLSLGHRNCRPLPVITFSNGREIRVAFDEVIANKLSGIRIPTQSVFFLRNQLSDLIREFWRSEDFRKKEITVLI